MKQKLVCWRWVSELMKACHGFLFKDADMCRQVVLRITDVVRADLPRYLGVVNSLLHRPVTDKLTVLAMEVLMLAHTHFSLPIEQVCFVQPQSTADCEIRVVNCVLAMPFRRKLDM